MRPMHILVGVGYCAVAVLNAGVALVLLVLARRRSSQVVMWRGRQIRDATLRASTLLCLAAVFGTIGVDHLLPGPSSITADLITGFLMLAALAAALTFEVVRRRRSRSGPNVVP
ncbi:hypothetical protein [Micromonospora sp. NPDC023633]|uniref:hypothetical protein n=1 Tax=Micromonospora sp. NPDC023633 TaxID=3154320 RepID=UPI0033FC2B8A